MKRTLIALTAAGALAMGTATMPTEAEALPAWVVPVIIITGVAGVVAGAAAAKAHQHYGPPLAYAGPQWAATQCRVAKVKSPSGYWKRVKVCDYD